jgi:hypothetical protein
MCSCGCDLYRKFNFKTKARRAPVVSNTEYYQYLDALRLFYWRSRPC